MITASGGIVYHARAARSLIKLLNPLGSWNPTRRHVSSWVNEWVELHKFKTLILVGPSAAYLIERQHWPELEQVIVIEPDRLAKWIFNRRKITTAHACQWIHRSDLLPYFSREPDEFFKFLQNYDPQTTGILFFGCLGQMAFHEKEYSRPERESRLLLLHATRQFKVASLHDLASVVVPTMSAKLARDVSELQLHFDGSAYCSATLTGLIKQVSDFLLFHPSLQAWTDHDTYWLGVPNKVCVWSLTRTRIHILGFTSQLPHS